VLKIELRFSFKDQLQIMEHAFAQTLRFVQNDFSP